MEAVRTADVDHLLHELTQPEGREDPYPRFDQLRRTGPVVLAEDGALVLSRYAECHAVLHDHRLGRPDNEEFFNALGRGRHPHLRLDGTPQRREGLTLRGYLSLPVAV